MNWMRWVVLLVFLVHAPLACSVWNAFRLAAALAGESEPRDQETPFSFERGQVLDFRPSDLSLAGRDALSAGNRFLVYPVIANPENSLSQPREEGESGTPSGSSPPSQAGKYQISWLDSVQSEVPQAPVSMTDMNPDRWQPITAFSPDPAGVGQFAWVVVDPEQALEEAGVWRWIERFYLSWTYPRLQLAMGPSNLAQRLQVWSAAQIVRQVRASVVSVCGKRLYQPCIEYVATFVQLAGAERNPDAVAEALEKGASFVAFPALGDPTGFSFHALREGHTYRMGSRVGEGSELIFQAARPVLFSLFQSGNLIRELEGLGFSFTAEEPGEYRILASRVDLPVPEGRPWIVTSPIFVGSE